MLTFAFATPLYGIIQLGSDTVHKPSPYNLHVPRVVLNALPAVFFLGYLVPSFLMIVPSDHIYISFDLRQIFIAIWQPWPGYVAILLTLVHLIFSPFVKDNNDQTIQGRRASLRSLRRVYAFAFGIAAISHLIAVSISLATYLVPVLFAEPFRTLLLPQNVSHTPIPWEFPVPQIENVAQGVHAFLRWDYLNGSAATLIWASILYVNGHRYVYGHVGWFGLIVKATLLSVVASPAAAAVELVWERDELVLSKGVLDDPARKDVRKGGEKI